MEIRGVDISSLPQVEENGGVFYDELGRQQDLLQILADHGINFIRLKLWHAPANGYNDLEHVKAMALRIADANMGLLLDFHYSDTWADPGKQYKPAAWTDLSYDELKTAVYEYTQEALKELIAQGTEPHIVQIGNEITHGMLWEDGKLDGSAGQYARLAGLLKAGIEGLKDSGSRAKIMLHLDKGGTNEVYVSWFDPIMEQGIDFDVIGLSFYAYWDGRPAPLAGNLAALAERYGKEMILVETSYAFTLEDRDGLRSLVREDLLVPGYPATVQGQAKWLRDMMAAVAAAPEGLGKGVFYWEPAWLALPGCGWDPEDPKSISNWANQNLFDFDGRVLPSMDVFLEYAPAEES